MWWQWVAGVGTPLLALIGVIYTARSLRSTSHEATQATTDATNNAIQLKTLTDFVSEIQNDRKFAREERDEERRLRIAAEAALAVALAEITALKQHPMAQ